MKYETDDTLGVLPVELHRKAIEYAKIMTEMQRPHASHSIIIDSFRECFMLLNEMGLLKETYEYAKTEEEKVSLD